MAFGHVRMRNVPNLLSVSRLVAVAGMLLAAWYSSTGLCVGLLVYALASDVLDGYLARALGTVSVRGAQLDSAADCALFLTLPAVALRLFPSLRASEGTTVALVFAGYALPVFYGLLKFRRLTSYHTTAARAAAVLLSAAFFLFLATDIGWPLRVATGVLVLSAIEEMAITRTLSEWHANVPSLRHALRYFNA